MLSLIKYLFCQHIFRSGLYCSFHLGSQNLDTPLNHRNSAATNSLCFCHELYRRVSTQHTRYRCWNHFTEKLNLLGAGQHYISSQYLIINEFLSYYNSNIFSTLCPQASKGTSVTSKWFLFSIWAFDSLYAFSITPIDILSYTSTHSYIRPSEFLLIVHGISCFLDCSFLYCFCHILPSCHSCQYLFFPILNFLWFCMILVIFQIKK